MLLMIVKLQEESVVDGRLSLSLQGRDSRHPCAHHSRPLPLPVLAGCIATYGAARGARPLHNRVSKLGSGPTENARACADVSKREIAMGDAAWDRIHRRDVTGVGDTGFNAGHAISGWCLVPIVTYSPD